MDEMFATDHTVSSNTINSIFKKSLAGTHFQFRDYTTAVSNRDLTEGITGLFTGLSGSNFSRRKGSTTDRLLLCQMEMAAPALATHKKSYPRMNLVSTCHDYSTKHVWTLGKNTIEALSKKNELLINTRLGKLAFPHKQDNIRSLKFISTVFVAPKTSNLQL
jgi:hypothetical protein